ncbi:MAG TPA: AgmX/PglI C-terminal domain-containing protein [Myxococcota bacterium]|nr:AgmX/PglI C-terminal domain-containing protein [Myxococcota bacterium]
MIIGLVIAIVGALLGVGGSLAVDWINADVVAFQDVSMYSATQWWTGALSIVLMAVAGILAALGLVTQRKKIFGISGLIATALSFIFLFLTPFVVLDVINAAIEAKVMSDTTTISMFYGYHLAFVGILLLFVGFVWSMVAQPILAADDRLLRVALLWDGKIIKETTFNERRDIIVGEGLNCDFVVPHAAPDGENRTLFKHTGKGQYSVGLTRDLAGRVHLDGRLAPLQDWMKANISGSGLTYVPLTKHDWGVLEFDNKVEVFFQFVRPSVIIGRSTAASMDGAFVAATVFSAFFLISIWIISQFVWNPAAAIVKHKSEKRVMKVEANIAMQKDEDILEITESDDDSVGKRAEGEEGKFGDPDKDPTLESKVPNRDGALTNKIDPKKIGLANVLSNQLGRSSAISSILSDNVDAFDNRMAVAMAGTGSELQVGYGAGGMGFKGTGPGGGGTGGYGRIHGLGRVDTGGGMGMRAGLGKKGTKKVGQMKLDSGASTGFCKKEDIRTNVMRRAGAIRACYEAQLQIHESLAGKTTIRWTIDGEGRVSEASIASSTLGNANVEQCVLRVIRAMRFQKPESGVCIVQWPFVFNPG